jgi:hypothetical protein
MSDSSVAGFLRKAFSERSQKLLSSSLKAPDGAALQAVLGKLNEEEKAREYFVSGSVQLWVEDLMGLGLVHGSGLVQHCRQLRKLVVCCCAAVSLKSWVFGALHGTKRCSAAGGTRQAERGGKST